MKGIKWSKWSAVAEIISSVAILVTLIYLAVQTQQNTAATRANSRHTIISSDLAILQSVIDHPNIANLMRASFQDFEGYTDEDKNQVDDWLVSLVRTREHQWLQYRNNLLDQQTWEAYSSGLSVNLSWPVTRGWWELVAYDYFDE